MKGSFLFALCVPLILQANMRDAEILQAMARFDEGFVPMWVHVQEGQWCEAEKDIFRVEFHWQRLLHNYLTASPGWACRADEDLGSAYRAIDAGRLEEAAGLLDGVRRALQDYRQREGLDYFLDPWWIAWDAAGDLAQTPSARNAERAAAALQRLSGQALAFPWSNINAQRLRSHQRESAVLARSIQQDPTNKSRLLHQHLLKGLAILGRVEEDTLRFAST